MNDYKQLQYNKTRFKASHNSYERNEDLEDQLAWNKQERWQSGCRGLELDIWRHSDNTQGKSKGYFTVAHNIPGNRPLADYLSDLRGFHNVQPTHDPIWITLDIKSTKGDVQPFPGEIDAYLSKWFGADLVLRPLGLFPGSELNIENVKKKGWPKINDMQGKFIFCLSGNEDWKKIYAKNMANESLCFADFNVSDDKSFEELKPTLPDNRIVLNMNVFNKRAAEWEASTKKLHDLGYLIRAYLFNSESIWSNGKKASINILATDKVRNHEWAYVGFEPFVSI